MKRRDKVLNDPVYGFVNLRGGIIMEIIEHPWFQRLRRIKQLGLTHLVYPGALHARFQHSIGAMHLMEQALTALRLKGHEISDDEFEASLLAILLHDIGHGPFSHALEYALVNEIDHEDISMIYMNRLNEQFDGNLEPAIQIFRNKHPKKFLHQLVSGQLDTDRLDYMNRDSFFCGVAEGVINDERILKMLNIHNNELVVDAKGIYSIEKFIVARRLMYWQVYLHKTVIGAEYLLMQILKRAKYLSRNGEKLHASPALHFFLNNEFFKHDFLKDNGVLEMFSKLDDIDIIAAVKVWTEHKDPILSRLAAQLVNRNLFAIELQKEPFDPAYVDRIKKATAKKFGLDNTDVNYFVFHDITSNYAYDPLSANIKLLYKTGALIDIAEAADQLNISVLSTPVTKYFLCYPKGL